MVSVRRTVEFDKWLKAMQDQRGKAMILIRIERLAAGNPGDVKPIGAGVSELRIDFGPGYRVYYKQRGDHIDLLLGGDKRSQARDAQRAKTLARNLAE
jgi:putative addiction module killer protein